LRVAFRVRPETNMQDLETIFDASLRRDIVLAFRESSESLPESPVRIAAAMEGEARSLLAFEPAWTIPDRIVETYRYGLDGLSPSGVRYMFGKLLLFCIDNPDSEAIVFVLNYTIHATDKASWAAEAFAAFDACQLLSIEKFVLRCAATLPDYIAPRSLLDAASNSIERLVAVRNHDASK
ncbi:MAG: hypothetical protein ABL931_15545, partial [Usitatibacteraceae bacterium]